MQPALQLVTRVLNSNHPFWMAILNMMNRKPVNPSRYPLHGHTNLSLVSIWEQLKNPHLHNEAKVLEDAGYDHCRAVALFLKDRLELGFASSYRKTPGMPTNFWGVTHGNNQNDPSMVTIQIEIAAEMIWPLLVPSYTQAEKGSVSLMLASTLLHELAVSARPTRSSLIITVPLTTPDAARGQHGNPGFDPCSGKRPPLHRAIARLG